MPRELRVHLGPHKTATTHLQQIARAPAPRRARRPRRRLPPGRAARRRSGPPSGWPTLAWGAVAGSRRDRGLRSGAGALAISDENLTGDSRDLFDGVPYRGLETRLAALARLATEAPLATLPRDPPARALWPSPTPRRCVTPPRCRGIAGLRRVVRRPAELARHVERVRRALPRGGDYRLALRGPSRALATVRGAVPRPRPGAAPRPPAAALDRLAERRGHCRRRAPEPAAAPRDAPPPGPALLPRPPGRRGRHLRPRHLPARRGDQPPRRRCSAASRSPTRSPAASSSRCVFYRPPRGRRRRGQLRHPRPRPPAPRLLHRHRPQRPRRRPPPRRQAARHPRRHHRRPPPRPEPDRRPRRPRRRPPPGHGRRPRLDRRSSAATAPSSPGPPSSPPAASPARPRSASPWPPSASSSPSVIGGPIAPAADRAARPALRRARRGQPRRPLRHRAGPSHHPQRADADAARRLPLHHRRLPAPARDARPRRDAAALRALPARRHRRRQPDAARALPASRSPIPRRCRWSPSSPSASSSRSR